MELLGYAKTINLRIVNQAAKTDSYPLPKINDLFASLAGGQTFSKLDLANAYL